MPVSVSGLYFGTYHLRSRLTELSINGGCNKQTFATKLLPLAEGPNFRLLQAINFWLSAKKHVIFPTLLGLFQPRSDRFINMGEDIGMLNNQDIQSQGIYMEPSRGRRQSSTSSIEGPTERGQFHITPMDGVVEAYSSPKSVGEDHRGDGEDNGRQALITSLQPLETSFTAASDGIDSNDGKNAGKSLDAEQLCDENNPKPVSQETVDEIDRLLNGPEEMRPTGVDEAFCQRWNVTATQAAMLQMPDIYSNLERAEQLIPPRKEWSDDNDETNAIASARVAEEYPWEEVQLPVHDSDGEADSSEFPNDLDPEEEIARRIGLADKFLDRLAADLAPKQKEDDVASQHDNPDQASQDGVSSQDNDPDKASQDSVAAPYDDPDKASQDVFTSDWYNFVDGEITIPGLNFNEQILQENTAELTDEQLHRLYLSRQEAINTGASSSPSFSLDLTEDYQGQPQQIIAPLSPSPSERSSDDSEASTTVLSATAPESRLSLDDSQEDNQRFDFDSQKETKATPLQRHIIKPKSQIARIRKSDSQLFSRANQSPNGFDFSQTTLQPQWFSSNHPLPYSGEHTSLAALTSSLSLGSTPPPQTGGTRMEILAKVEAIVSEQEAPRIRAELAAKLEEELRSQLMEEVKPKVDLGQNDDLHELLTSLTLHTPKVGSGAQLGTKANKALAAEIRKKVEADLRPLVAAQLQQVLEGPMRTLMEQNLRVQIEAEQRESFQKQYNQERDDYVAVKQSEYAAEFEHYSKKLEQQAELKITTKVQEIQASCRHEVQKVEHDIEQFKRQIMEIEAQRHGTAELLLEEKSRGQAQLESHTLDIAKMKRQYDEQILEERSKGQAQLESYTVDIARMKQQFDTQLQEKEINYQRQIEDLNLQIKSKEAAASDVEIQRRKASSARQSEFENQKKLWQMSIENEIDDYRNQLMKAREEISNLEKPIEEIKVQYAKDLAKAKKELKGDYDRETIALKSAHVEQEEKLETELKRVIHLMRKSKALEKSYVDERGDLQTQLDDTMNDLRESKMRSRASSETVSKCRKQIDALSSQISESDEVLARKNKELETKAGTIRKLQGNISAREKEIEELANQTKLAWKKLDEEKKQRKFLQEKKEKAEADLCEWRGRFQHLERLVIEKPEVEVETLADALASESVQMREDFERLGKELQESHEKLHAQKLELNEAKLLAQEMGSKAEEERQRREEEVMKAEEKTRQAREEVKQAQKETKRANEEVKKTRKEAKNAQEETEKAQEEVRNTWEKTRNAQEEAKKAQAEVKKARKEAVNAHKETEKAQEEVKRARKEANKVIAVANTRDVDLQIQRQPRAGPWGWVTWPLVLWAATSFFSFIILRDRNHERDLWRGANELSKWAILGGRWGRRADGWMDPMIDLPVGDGLRR